MFKLIIVPLAAVFFSLLPGAADADPPRMDDTIVIGFYVASENWCQALRA